MIAVTLLSLFVAGSALSADGTITINGKVIDQTCEVSTQYKNLVVTLPTVGTKSLQTQGNTAGYMPFSIKLENCKAKATDSSQGATKVFAFFHNSTLVDPDNNYTLKNKLQSGQAQHVNIQLVNANETKTPIYIGKTTDPATSAGAVGYAQNSVQFDLPQQENQAVILNYGAQYYATGTATPGQVQTSVEYTIAYD